MVRRFRHSSYRALGLLAALLWAFTVAAGQVHRIVVAHSVCAEHHEIVESPRGAHASHADADHDRPGPSAWDVAPHDAHGCQVGVLLPSGPPPPFVLHRAALRVLGPVELFVLAHPARGPPLDYAPKTSPPRVG